MDFMPALLEESEKRGGKIFLYGSTPSILEKLTRNIQTLFPSIQIVGAISPPFRELLASETAEHIDQINNSKANFVLVALGCPKQETWMAQNHSKINAVLLGVGGAFPVIAGVQKRSPKLMQNLSLEWLYRLKQEPRRLFKRYLYTNVYFIGLLLRNLQRKSL